MLLADDNADMRNYLGNLLSPHYEVETAANGKDAVARAMRNPFHARLFASSGGEQNYRNAAGYRTSPQGRKQSEAIQFRHHNVG